MSASFFDHYELVRQFMPKKGSTKFNLIGVGGFGVVLEGRLKGPSQIQDGSCSPEVEFPAKEEEGERRLAVKIVEVPATEADELFDREYHHLVGSLPPADALLLPVDAFVEARDPARPDGKVRLFFVTELSPFSKVMPFYQDGPAEISDPDLSAVDHSRPKMSGADLVSICHPRCNSAELSLLQLRAVMKQLLQAVKHLHDNNFIHRDLKPDNLLVFDVAPMSRFFTAEELASEEGEGTAEVEAPVVKLVDFGFCRRHFGAEHDLTRRKGSKAYMAPEVAMRSYTKAIDLFSAGCTFFALVTRLFPNDDPRTAFESGRFFKSNDEAYNAKVLSKFPSGSVHLDFLARLTLTDPARRMTAEQALEHPFITGAC